MLNPSRKYYITTRRSIATNLTYTGRRKEYAFRLIIPPVTHKPGILHNDIQPLWSKAEDALRSTERIVVFGYSCPSLDFEAANLLRRTVPRNPNLREFYVDDQNPAVFQRYADLTQLPGLHYFRSAKEYQGLAGNPYS